MMRAILVEFYTLDRQREFAYLIHQDGDGPLVWRLDRFHLPELRGKAAAARTRLYAHGHPDYPYVKFEC